MLYRDMPLIFDSTSVLHLPTTHRHSAFNVLDSSSINIVRKTRLQTFPAKKRQSKQGLSFPGTFMDELVYVCRDDAPDAEVCAPRHIDGLELRIGGHEPCGTVLP